MILVTGATGILGRVIVLELLKRGENVRATKRSSKNLQEVQDSYRFYTEAPEEYFKKIQWTEVDFDDINSIKAALNGVDEVYHCAAKVSFAPKDDKEMYRMNVEGTKNLLYACEDFPIHKFLHVSSIAVLDNFNEKGELDEDSDFNPKFDHSTYAITKHLSEMEVWRSVAEGLKAVIINPGMIVASGNWNQSSGAIFDTFADNPYTFSGGSSYVDVRDVAKIAIETMEKKCFGERFVLISENVRYSKIGYQIRRKLGLKEAKIVSKFQLNLGWIANILLGWLIPKLRIITKSNIQSITSYNTVSNQKVKDRFGFQFIPVQESVDFHLNNYINDKNKKSS